MRLRGPERPRLDIESLLLRECEWPSSETDKWELDDELEDRERCWLVDRARADGVRSARS
jgi:hypothetical protein